MNVTIRPTGSDDTQLLRTAISQAESFSTITLDGVFRVAGSVECRRSNITLDCYGACLKQAAENAKTLALHGCENVRILGAALVGVGIEKPWKAEPTPYNGVAAVYLSQCSSVTLRDCRMTNHAGGSVVLDGECNAIRVLDCTIKGMGAEHIHKGESGCDAAIAGTSNSITKTGIVLRGNDISGHAFGLLIPGDVSAIIESNHIHHIPGQHGMYMARGGDCVVSSNLIDHCAMIGLKFQHQTPEHIEPLVSIHNNIVSDCGSIAIGVLNTGAGIGFTQSNVSLTSNNVTRCGYPLYLRGLRDMMVAHNRASHCERGLFKQDCAGVFEDNLFVQCG
jgi:nitrous oxidase accessory protein NosD